MISVRLFTVIAAFAFNSYLQPVVAIPFCCFSMLVTTYFKNAVSFIICISYRCIITEQVT